MKRKYLIRPLKSQADKEFGVGIFSKAINQRWGIPHSVAQNWVKAEFQHPSAVIFGAFWLNCLVGVGCCIPLVAVLEDLTDQEIEQLKNTLRMNCRGVSYSQIIHIGGLGINREENLGLGNHLAQEMINYAGDHGYNVIIARTASNNPKLINWHRRVWGGEELFRTEKTTWLWASLNTRPIEKILE